MLNAFWSTILLILSAAPATLLAQERYFVSYAGFGGFQAQVWAAQGIGLFKKYGLNTYIVMIPGSTSKGSAYSSLKTTAQPSGLARQPLTGLYSPLLS